MITSDPALGAPPSYLARYRRGPGGNQRRGLSGDAGNLGAGACACL